MRVINFTGISTASFRLHPAHLDLLPASLCDRFRIKLSTYVCFTSRYAYAVYIESVRRLFETLCQEISDDFSRYRNTAISRGAPAKAKRLFNVCPGRIGKKEKIPESLFGGTWSLYLREVDFISRVPTRRWSPYRENLQGISDEKMCPFYFFFFLSLFFKYRRKICSTQISRAERERHFRANDFSEFPRRIFRRGKFSASSFPTSEQA